MKKTILVTSVIAFEGCSEYQSEMRLRQTIYTLNSLKTQYPDAYIIFCDCSAFNYCWQLLRIFPAVDYIYLNGVDSKLAYTIRSTNNKSLGESLLLRFLHKHRSAVIEDSDFLIKVSGRYFFSNLTDNWFTEKNKNAYFFISPHKTDYRPWVDEFNTDYSTVYQGSKLPNQRQILHTVIYGCGKHKISQFFEINNCCIDILSLENYNYYTVENLWFFLLNKNSLLSNIVYTDWAYYGWNGGNDKFVAVNATPDDYAFYLTAKGDF